MSAADSSPSPGLPRHGSFQTTRWSLVLEAQRALAAQGALATQGQPAPQGKLPCDARQSLEALCRQYWPPLYAYVRQRGHADHDAQDLTQAFFAQLLEKGWLAAADRQRGRFRAFLLMALQRFLANEWDRSQTQKRGGRARIVSLDAAETMSFPDPGAAPAEAIYERRWAMTLLEAVMRRLREEYQAGDRLAQYERLKPCLTAERGSIDYAELAMALNLEPASARSAVHRLRKRFRELFREEVAATVADPADVEDELRSVIAALGAP